jgi:hypothetical protein
LVTVVPAGERARLSFSGHESFPLRYAWLPKAVRELARHPDLFTREDAPVLLGVGRNMVASIRHWSLATGIVELRDARSGLLTVSSLGLALFSEAGWDPYLEDPATLWLLHWRLVRKGERASAWWLTFGQWAAATFTRDQLAAWLLEIARGSPTTRATPASIRRDVDVFVRTYVPTRASRDLSPEDTFDCPLVELGLLHEVEPRVYAFTRNARPSLPDGLFAYALLDFWRVRHAGLGTMSFEAIQSGLGSPGSAFRLTAPALAERLEALPEWTGLRYDETAGTRVVLRTGSPNIPNVNPVDALERLFGPLSGPLDHQRLLWEEDSW